MPELSVVIVSYDSASLLLACLQSLEENVDMSYEVIVVENHPDGDLDTVTERFPYVRVVYNTTNEGFGAGNNRGVKQANGQYLLFINPDTELKHGSLRAMTQALEETPHIGSLAFALLKSEETVQAYQYGSFLTLRNLVSRSFAFPQVETPLTAQPAWQSVHWHSGGAFLTRKEVFDELEGFDERFFMYFEDMDLCKRMFEAGYTLYWTKNVLFTHTEGGTQGPRPETKRRYYASQRRYLRKHTSFGQHVWIYPIHLILLGKVWLESSTITRK